MGTNISICCNKCNYQQLFSVGYGLYHDVTHIFYGDELQFRKMVTSPEDRVFIRDIMFSHTNVEVMGSEFRIYYCPYCGNLHENYYFSIKYGSGIFSPRYYCSRCETKMEPLKTNWLTFSANEPIRFINCNGQPISLCCPECGSKAIKCCDAYFDWD